MMIFEIKYSHGSIRSRSDSLARSPRGDRRGIQIGPRIRVGGTLGKIGQDVKITAGKVLANPIVDAGLTLIPGVGPGIAAAAGGLGKVLDTSNGSVGVGNVLGGAASGYAAGLAGGAIKGGVGALTGSGSIMDKLGAIKGLVTNGANIFGGGAAAAGAGGAGGAGGGSSLGDKLLLGGSVAAAAADKLRQQGLQDKGVNYATGAYDEKAPLRAKAIATLENPTTPDLSSIFSDPGNVYDAQRRGVSPTRTPVALPSAAAPAATTDLSRVPVSQMSALANSY